MGGYASSGESFSIADPHEVWLMEIIGKGNFSKGAVWVAGKVPDGYVCAHANQARIRTFPRNDSAWKYSEDVVSFAREHGIYHGSDEDFSFSDVYDPVTFEGARFCEARVFSFFKSVATTDENIDQYLDYVKGENLSNRMPLFIRTNQRLSVNDTMWHMRNHYEGTWFDSRYDVSAGEFSSPYRLGMGLTWDYGGKTYVNERPIGTYYAGWNVIMTQRPTQKYSVVWWGAGDSTFSPKTPFYGVTTRIPNSFSGSNCTGRSLCRVQAGLPGTVTEFSWDTMHWATHVIGNYAYSSYAAVSDAVKMALAQHEAAMFEAVRAKDLEIETTRDERVSTEIATSFSSLMAERLHDSWKMLFGELFMTYVGGFKTVPDETVASCGCRKEHLGWGNAYKAGIADETGTHYLVPEGKTGSQMGRRHMPISKLSLRALGGNVRPCSSSQNANRNENELGI